MVFNRKRKDNRSPSFHLDDSPKRTKVQAQRKFAAGSNVNSPVLTPVKELERQEKMIPEPLELIPMKRPNTEDFLTFLCFRGTPVLPTTLNFFNNASMIDTRTQTNESPSTSPKNGVILPSTISKTQGDRPFIAFGVRKRADPIVVSRHMDKKRRHALALQALRRKYQEQKMAKIRAITISKLSEKVQTNKTVVRTTRSITKSAVTKKNISHKTKITVVATKRVKVTTRRTSTLKQTLKQLKQPIRSTKKQKMCLRSYRGRFVQRELLNKPVKKRPMAKLLRKTKESQKNKEQVEDEEEVEDDEDEAVEEEEEEEEFSSDDDEPLLKKVDGKMKGQRIARKTASGPKKTSDIRLTRSNMLNQIKSRRAANKRLLARAQNTLKSPPTSPRLRARLQKRKLLKKTDITVPIKKKIISRKVEIKTKTTGNKVDQVKRIENKNVTKIITRELRKPISNKSKEGESSKSSKKEEELKKPVHNKNKEGESSKSNKKEEELKKPVYNKNKESESTKSIRKDEELRKQPIYNKSKEGESSKTSKKEEVKKRIDKPAEETIKKKDVIRSEDKAETRRSFKKIEEDKMVKPSTSNKDKKSNQKQEEIKASSIKEKKNIQKQEEETKIVVEDKRNTRESLKKQALQMKKTKKFMKKGLKIQKEVEKKAPNKTTEDKLKAKKIKAVEKKIEEPPLPEKKIIKIIEKKKVDDKKNQKKNIKIIENEVLDSKKNVKNDENLKDKNEENKDESKIDDKTKITDKNEEVSKENKVESKIEDKIKKNDKSCTKEVIKSVNKEKKVDIKQDIKLTPQNIAVNVKECNKKNLEKKIDKKCDNGQDTIEPALETKPESLKLIPTTSKQIDIEVEVLKPIINEKKMKTKSMEASKKIQQTKDNTKTEVLKIGDSVDEKSNPKNEQEKNKLIVSNITSESTVSKIDITEPITKEIVPIIKTNEVKILEIEGVKFQEYIPFNMNSLKSSFVDLSKPKELCNINNLKMISKQNDMVITSTVCIEQPQNNKNVTNSVEKPMESQCGLTPLEIKCIPSVEIQGIKPSKEIKENKKVLLPESKQEIRLENKVMLVVIEDRIKVPLVVEEDANNLEKDQSALVIKGDNCKDLLVVKEDDSKGLLVAKEDDRKSLLIAKEDDSNVSLVVKEDKTKVLLNVKDKTKVSLAVKDNTKVSLAVKSNTKSPLIIKETKTKAVKEVKTTNLSVVNEDITKVLLPLKGDKNKVLMVVTEETMNVKEDNMKVVNVLMDQTVMKILNKNEIPKPDLKIVEVNEVLNVIPKTDFNLSDKRTETNLKVTVVEKETDRRTETNLKVTVLEKEPIRITESKIQKELNKSDIEIHKLENLKGEKTSVNILLNKNEDKPEVKKSKPKIDKLNLKTNDTIKKTAAEKKDTIIDDTGISKRPSRKTKEAAAIYMEILGHKLGNDEDIDDVSIDSFPELPNVRKTEQREIELKAKANIKPLTSITPDIEEPSKKRKSKSKSIESSDSETIQKPKRLPIESRKLKKSKLSRDEASDSDESFTMEIKMPTETLSRQTRNRSPKLYKSFSDTDSESDFVPLKKPPKKKSENLTDSEQKTKLEVPKKIKEIPKKPEIDSFSESDEEPLVKLTQKKEVAKVKKKPDEIIVGKQKRECTKRPQNYLTLFSSSDEEDQCFHGFVKCESPPKPKVIKSEPTIDLLFTKDVGRRYGKEKVNMSNEQIEKWLNDSALAGMSVIKKENDEMLKFGEKIPTETSLDTNSPINTDTLKDSLLKTITKEDKKDESLSSTPEKSISPSKPQSNERKTIFRKEKTEPLRNVNAFSVCNESSVYAFEADNEDSISTPFRRPSRRPSSTATSRSEDDLSRLDPEFIRAGKFRLPNLVRHDSNPKLKELTDDSNNSSSQVIDHDPEIHQQVTEHEHLFYIPKGVAMKGTGANQQKKLSPAKQEKPLGTATQMYPPSHISMQKNKTDNKSNLKLSCNRSSDRLSETSEEFKYKIPSSPSASSSSSAKLYKRQTKSKVKVESYPSVNVTEFPNLLSPAQIVEAPVFHPSEKEFADPLEYIEKIRVKAEKFGICRIVPPANFKPECKVLDEMRFTAYNQYVHKMMHRWGPNFRELVAIRKYLATQSISLKHPPWIGGMEIDLPRLYQIVQTLGGLKEVIEKKKWPRVSELMKIPKSAQDRVTKLDDIYCKFLLPYDTLTPDERDKLFDSVETEWAKRESKNLMKAQQAADDDKLEIDDNESEDEEESDTECIVKGRSMALSAFYRIARNTMSMWFKTSEPTATEVEDEFWKHVTTKQYHLCVHSGSIDSGSWGYGFAVSKNSPFARHAWNLKVLTNNSGSILRSMGPIMGLTVPTLHVGMVFSGCCWYRDPHSLPWIEYLHTGGNKIWYGIPDSMSEKFHSTLLKLVPNYCLNKSIWLPSDTVMLPPNILVDNGVSLTRTVQQPGEFVVIFPKAFTSNICTGYVVSESVFFASSDWLKTAENVFEEMRNSCEPSMFSYEKLLLNIVADPRSDIAVLKQIIPAVGVLCERERKDREKLKTLGVVNEEKLPLPDLKKKKKMHELEIEYTCEDCRWNLFCSMVFEIQENAVYCIDHAIEHIKEKELEPANCKLMFTYDSSELDVLVDKLKSTIEMKIQKKAGSKFTGLATLMNR